VFDWSKDDLSTLHEIAHEAGQSDELRHFADYCLNEAGRHETEAFASLRLFLHAVSNWTAADKRAFVDWLLRVQHNHPTLENLIHPTLHHEMLEPVMQRWREEAPDDPCRLRWSGRIEDLERARSLAPDDLIIQRRLIEALLKRIRADCGHLPAEYPGHPQEDDALLAEAIGLLNALPSRSKHDKRLLAETQDLRKKLAALIAGGNVTIVDVEIPEEDL